MTKPITSVAVLMLLEESCFRLNDPVAAYLQAFKDSRVLDSTALVKPQRPMTIRDLLTHTAGLSYGFDENDYLDQLYRQQLSGSSGIPMPSLTSAKWIGLIPRTLPVSLPPRHTLSLQLCHGCPGLLRANGVPGPALC